MNPHRARRGMPTWIALVVTMVLGIGAWREAATAKAAQQRSIESDPTRAALMRKHFDQALAIEDGVIRGDLAAVSIAANALANYQAPAGLPTAGAPFVAAMKQAAQRAASAKNLATAAHESATMLATCGNCHQTVGIRPAFPSPPTPAPGGVVGHMLEHQRAVDLMLQGLVVPSTTLWEEGAQGLKGARLHERQLPRDSRLTPEIITAEDRVHRLASTAVDIHDPSVRATTYAQLLATCAECHGLHQKLWGPSRQ
jgi:mono/diheme cytochrome c family protein